ncbi:galactokinase [Haloechinothrix sp. LS1_15]|uniref:galactokinase n=1 Tax=Haloechinothrix sp. LS1_15 TaxID=2652248 RepID=UPI0029486695|nr:galactokinase [Haloechinothrix sp. LS1_15]MDV6011646.1 galactokinase [Haloechinothrix sp. LS1_15]
MTAEQQRPPPATAAAVSWLAPGDPDTLAAELVDDFTSRFGDPPVSVHAAPGRVNLIGEHLDYNGGCCLPLALPHRTFVALRPRDDDTVQLSSKQRPEPWFGTLDHCRPGEVRGWPAYAAGVLWALGAEANDVPGVDVLIDSRVPTGAGLASSAALETALALALAEVLHLPTDSDGRRRLAQACVRAEQEVAGAPTGGMDQTVALLAEAGSVLHLDCASGTATPLPWPPGDRRLLVIDTRVRHALIDGRYSSRREECDAVAAELGVTRLREVTDLGTALPTLGDTGLRGRLRHVATEQHRTDQARQVLVTGDWFTLGELLDASHTSLREDFAVSCAELDTAVAAAREAGADGARMTGGGFGGSAIALVDDDHLSDVAVAVDEAFTARDWHRPRFLLAEPAGPAQRLR